MISIEQIREFQADFEPTRLAGRSNYKEREKLRREFEKRFPRDRLLLLSPDEYVQGKGDKGSFCYWVEWRLSELGHIQGTPAKKFGVFHNKEKNSLEFTKEFGNEENPFRAVLNEIVTLLDAAEANDSERIRTARISPMFKGKILFLYFPKNFLNIYSERHIDHFLSGLRLNQPGTKLDLVSKRELLVNFKNTDDVMRHWSMFEFHDFLYHAWHYPPSQENVTPQLKDYVLDFPAPEDTNPEFISLKTTTVTNDTEDTEQKRSGVIDFEKRNRRNRLVGNQGEDIVLLIEKKEPCRNGKPKLAGDVQAVCRINDDAGYDILSFELDGTPKQIEVKSTVCRPPNPGSSFTFFLSANEYEQAQTLENFYLYIVFEVKSKTPKIWRIKNPAHLAPANLVLTPSTFLATLTVS